MTHNPLVSWILVFRLECLVINVNIIPCLRTSPYDMSAANMPTGEEDVGMLGQPFINFVGQTMPDNRTCHVGKKSANMLVDSF